MSNFKKQAAQKRAAVPQVDLESVKPAVPTPVQVESKPKVQTKSSQSVQDEPAPAPAEADNQAPRLTQVDTSETPTNHGFSMYPSRHRQVAKDLAYIEDRNPWKIIDDALEEYVVKHYGKEHKRK